MAVTARVGAHSDNGRELQRAHGHSERFSDNRQARDRTTEIAGLASDSRRQTLSAASISAPISGAE